MATMNVSLPAEFIAFVEGAVASGDYRDAGEVMRDGLRLLRREKAVAEEKQAILKREVLRGVEQARNGEFSKLTIRDIAAAAASDEV
jgi:antitoxin ParD1/3/4